MRRRSACRIHGRRIRRGGYPDCRERCGARVRCQPGVEGPRPDPRRARDDGSRRGAGRTALAFRCARGGGCLCRGRSRRVRDGAHAEDQSRAVDGRALVPGESRRIQGGDRRLGDVRAGDAHDDDRGRHGAAGTGLRARGGGGRAAGDRDGAPPGRHRQRHRRPPRGQGAGREPRGIVRDGGERGGAGRGDGRRLRPGDEARTTGAGRPSWWPTIWRSRTS